jgi:hypothetical protein
MRAAIFRRRAETRGRKQYRYHPEWRATRDADKYGRLLAFGAALKLRACVERDLALDGMPRDKVLATVVRLLDTTLIRDRERRVRARQSLIRIDDAAQAASDRVASWAALQVSRQKRHRA